MNSVQAILILVTGIVTLSWVLYFAYVTKTGSGISTKDSTALVISIISLAISASVFIYVQRVQVHLARLEYLKKLENDASTLYATRHARLSIDGRYVQMRYRNILDDKQWRSGFTNQNIATLNNFAVDPAYPADRASVTVLEGDNYILVRDDGAYIATTALNDTLVLFRQIRRSMEGISLFGPFLSSEDVGVLWRFVIPWTHSGRYDFLRHYYGEGDFKDIQFVLQSAFRQIHEQHGGLPKNMASHLDQTFLDDLGMKRCDVRIARS